MCARGSALFADAFEDPLRAVHDAGRGDVLHTMRDEGAHSEAGARTPEKFRGSQMKLFQKVVGMFGACFGIIAGV